MNVIGFPMQSYSQNLPRNLCVNINSLLLVGCHGGVMVTSCQGNMGSNPVYSGIMEMLCWCGCHGSVMVTSNWGENRVKSCLYSGNMEILCCWCGCHGSVMMTSTLGNMGSNPVYSGIMEMLCWCGCHGNVMVTSNQGNMGSNPVYSGNMEMLCCWCGCHGSVLMTGNQQHNNNNLYLHLIFFYTFPTSLNIKG